MKTIHEIELDVSLPYKTILCSFHQGDVNSRELRIRLYDRGRGIELSSAMDAEYDAVTDGLIVAAAQPAIIETESNMIRIPLSALALSVPGTMRLELKISENGEIITAKEILIEVEPGLITPDSIPAPQFTDAVISVLRSIVGDTVDPSVVAGAVADYLDAHPQDYSTVYTKSEVDSLLGDFDDDISALSAETERTANKATILSQSSTDTQYPSAKAVYTALKDKTSRSEIKSIMATGKEPFDYFVAQGQQSDSGDDISNTHSNKTKYLKIADSSDAAAQYLPTSEIDSVDIGNHDCYIYIRQYDSGKTFISRISRSANTTYVPPSNVAYIKISGYRNDGLSEAQFRQWVTVNCSSKALEHDRALSDTYTKSQIDSMLSAGSISEDMLTTALKTKLNGKENASNKASGIPGIAGNQEGTQYPSVAAVRAFLGDYYVDFQTHDDDLGALDRSKEDVSNKVTSISQSSTDTQYPTAKAVYDAIQAALGGV